MNIIPTLLFFIHLFPLFQKKFQLSLLEKQMILLGVFQPLLDQIARKFVGEIQYQIEGQYFHSLWYSLLFWSGLAFFAWVYFQDRKMSRLFLFPLVGLFGYAVISFFTTSGEYFFFPFTLKRIRLDWVDEGIFIPVVIMVVLFIAKSWPRFSVKRANSIALASLGGYILIMGAIKFLIFTSLTYDPIKTRRISIYPQNWPKFQWVVVLDNGNQYVHGNFALFSGKLEAVKQKEKVNDQNLIASILKDPTIYQYYKNVFRNPIIHIQIGKETSTIQVLEIVPAVLPWKNADIEWKKNRFGQIVEWNLLKPKDI